MTFESITQQIAAAGTTQERQDARRLLQAWVLHHPDDKFAPSLFFLLDCMEEDARKSAAALQALHAKMQALGASCLTHDEIVRVGLSASGLQEIAEARRALHEWERAHPDEPKMYAVFEQLYMREDAARGEADEEQSVLSGAALAAATA